MAKAAVESLQQNLRQLLLHHPHLITNAKEDVEALDNIMYLLSTFLRDASPHMASEHLLMQIAEKVLQIEDVLDPFVYASASADQSVAAVFRRPAPIPVPPNLTDVVRGIKTFVEEHLNDTTAGASNPTMAETLEMEIIKVPIWKEEKAVGFEDEMEVVIESLMEEADNLDVISIVGMAGQGKTTLARRIFNDPKIINKFQPRIWVTVSQDYRRKDAFISISEKFPGLDTEDDQERIKIIRKQLDQLNFLIVLDDVCSAEVWDDLQVAFPKASQRGKILVTSPNEEVAHRANPDRTAHRMRLLTPDEGWSLLQSKLPLREDERFDCSPRLESIGRSIVEKCRGLPLAVTMIGGILSREPESIDAWTKILGTVDTYFQEKPFSWSYSLLPDHLKPCFLYLGMFPKGEEIQVWRVVRLWIAEGFIPQKEGTTMEQTAYDYLVDLINRSLVIAEKKSIGDRKVKTCHIHHVLHDFCRIVPGPNKTNLYREIKKSGHGGGFDPLHHDDRRICIHSSPGDFISSKPIGAKVRTFLCFSKAKEAPLSDEHASSIPSAFNLLRVLDAKPVTLNKFPRGSSKMVHLRYIVLSGDFKVLPEAISELWNLQTFAVYTSAKRLAIKANIWRMIQLRHVKTNQPATLPKPKEGEESENLQTLGMVSFESCTEHFFAAACNLTQFAIGGSLINLFSTKGLDKLWKLEKLKLKNDTSEGVKLEKLPPPYNFPPNLRKLTLCATRLAWSEMSTLGMLEKLEILKLKENAFVGSDWKITTADGFPCLEVLLIESTDLVTWDAEADHFPSLKCLVLRDCKSLEELPSSLGEIESLMRMELKGCNTKAGDSARKIVEVKKNQDQEYGASSNLKKFQLDISNPHIKIQMIDGNMIAIRN